MKLVVGAAYTLAAKSPPDGYEIAGSIPFTVTGDATKDSVMMKDYMTKSGSAGIAVAKELRLNGELINAVDESRRKVSPPSR